jgi:hypothetical protein
VLSAVAPRGQVVLVLGVPLVAAVLSYDDYSTSAAATVLLLAGAAYAWLVSLARPERGADDRPGRVLPERRTMLGYGVRLGVAAALAYLVAVGLDLDTPVGRRRRACSSPRPQVDLLQSRGEGRVGETVLGVALAYVFGWLVPALDRNLRRRP